MNLFDSKTLLIILAVGQGLALVYASVVLDGHVDIYSPLFWLALAKGLPLGMGAAFSASFAGHKLSRSGGGKGKLGSTARAMGAVSLGLQVACTAVVVAICNVEAPVGALRWVASVAYSLMVEASVIAVSSVSAAMFAESAATGDKPAVESDGQAPVKKQPAPKAAETAPGHWSESRSCPHCTAAGVTPCVTTTSKAEYSGRVGVCANNPKNKNKKEIDR